MKKLITDRVGNNGDFRPYFALWSAPNAADGALRIYAVEHDGTSSDVSYMPKGDGWSRNDLADGETGASAEQLCKAHSDVLEAGRCQPDG